MNPALAASSSDSSERARIRRLDARLINQIAAGEVIVRPASAIKEMIENSLDAGAERIEVEVEEDARGFSVRDDGCGMGPEDARLAVERYATSKIRELDDLSSLTTRGFRGEALAAITSVCRFEMFTRRRGDAVGAHLRCFGGVDPTVVEVGAPEGCLIRVRDLFYNTPARLKFMKGPVVEWGHILREVIRQSLTRSDVGFAIRWRGRPFLTLPPGQTLAERFAATLPGDAAHGLIEIDAELHGARAHGVVSAPNNTRRDRRHQYFFANGRPIVSRPLTFALQEAYRGLIMTQRFPVAAVFIDLPPDQIDVNVHPTKEEVRFLNESLAAGVIHRAALVALKKTEMTHAIHLPTPGARFATAGPAPAKSAGERGRADRAGDQAQAFSARDAAQADARRPDAPMDAVTNAPTSSGAEGGPNPAGNAPGFFRPERAPASPTPADSAPGPGARVMSQTDLMGAESDDADGSVIDVVYSARSAAPANGARRGSSPSEVAGDPDALADPAALEDATLIDRLRREGVRPRALAQIELTYILADAPGHGLLLIDQHAAQEKLLYLKFRARPERRAVQELLAPYEYEAAPSERPWLELLAPLLTAEGFETEPFGGSTFLVRSVPLVFEGMNVTAFLRDLIGEAQGESRRELDAAMETLRRKIGAMAACRAAIKAGDPLNIHEMQALVDQTLSIPEAQRCPHGRPTLLLLGKDQLDRQFGRLG